MFRQASVRHPRRHSVRAALGTGSVILLLLLIFIGSVYWFRQPLSSRREGAISTGAVSSLRVPEATFLLDLESAEAILTDVSGGPAKGVAKRETKEGIFFHSLKSQLLPIDRDKQFYEGWLVRPVPFDFFSTGEIVTNSLGEFVLEWNGESGKDYQAYTEVVVTLEDKDGNPDPAKHILEGMFGNEDRQK